MSTRARGNSGISAQACDKRASPPKCTPSPAERVGNKGEYPYYCHRGDALSATAISEEFTAEAVIFFHRTSFHGEIIW